MFLKNKVFLFLSVVLFVTGLPGFSSVSGSDKCWKVFIPIRMKIKDKTSKDKEAFIRNYKRQEGYLRLTEELGKGTNMYYVFTIVSSIIKPRGMEKLGWQQYQGSAAQFREEQGRILDEEGK